MEKEVNFAPYLLALLGLGCAGIFSKATIWMGGAVFVAVEMRKNPDVNHGAWVLAVLAPFAFTAEVEGDSIMYCIPLALRTLAYHSINLPVENTVGTWMHEAELVLALAPEHGRAISVGCFTGCAVILWDMMDKAGIKNRWLAPVIILTSHSVFNLSAASKYDCLSLMLLFVCAHAQQAGKPFRAGLAAGCAITAKLTAAPVAAALILLGGSPVKTFAGVAIPVLPWMARQFLHMGNPFYPTYGSEFSRYNFYPPQRKAEMMANYSALRTPNNLLATFVPMNPLVAWATPLALNCRSTWVGILGGLAILCTLNPSPRYLLPVLPFLAVPAVRALENFQVRKASLVIYSAVALTFGSWYWWKAISSGRITPTYREAMAVVGNKKTITWGEERKYPHYRKTFKAWPYLSPPLMWDMVRSGNILKRMKQLDVEYILVNPVSLKTQEQFARNFPLDGKKYGLAKDFLENHCRIEWRGRLVDEGGRYELYRITP